MLTWWLFCIHITCALLYIESCYHVYSYIFAYVYVYLFRMTVCCMITIFFFMLYVWLLLFFRDVHMLIISIDSLTCFCLVTLLVVWLSCFPWHVYSHFCISHSSWHDWFSLLYIILFVSTYCPLCYIPILFILSLPSLCVDMSDILILCMTTWCMTAFLLCDVVCLYRSHIYLLTSNPLVSVISFISVLTFVSVSCVYLFLWPS